MCPSAPRVCSEPGGQKPILSLSLDRIIHLVHTLLFLWFALCFLQLPVLWGSAWFDPYPPGLLHRLWGNHMIAPVPVKQPWRIWVKCITWIHQEPSYNYIKIKPNKSHKQRFLTPGHQGWNDLHSLCRIGMEYYLLNNDDNNIIYWIMMMIMIMMRMIIMMTMMIIGKQQ